MIKNKQLFDESKPANFDGVFDWDFLKPAFAPTKIEPTDIDAVVERKGFFLFMETKPENKEIPMGQKIMYENLIKLGCGKITIFFIWGKSEDTIYRLTEWHFRNGKIMKINNENIDGGYLLERCRAWFRFVNKGQL